MKKGLIERLGISGGDWIPMIGHRTGNIFGIRSGDKNIINCHGISRCQSSEGQKNAKLILKSKDLLNSYINLVIESINNEYAELTARFSRSKTEQEILKIAEGRLSEEIKLIEDCSGVSWDEIKMIMEEMRKE